MKKNYYLIIALFIILTATFLRLYNLGGFITFLGDQGRDASIIRNIITFKHFPAIGAPSSVGQIYLGPFYYYLMAPWLLIFNFNPVGLGYGVAIMSIIGLTACYFIIRKECSEIIALTFLAIITFSFTLVNLSRFSWNPNLLPIFSFMTLYFFHLWVTQKKNVYAAIFGSLLALTVQLHHLALLLFGPLTLMLAYHFYRTNEKKKLLIQMIPTIGAFIFFSSPLIVFDLRHDFLNTKSFMKLFSSGNVVSEGSYLDRLTATINGFFHFSFQMPEYTSGAIIVFILLLCIYAWIIKKTKSDFLLLHLLTVTIFIFGFALLNSPRHYHYYGPAYLSFYLLIASILMVVPKGNWQYVVSSFIGIIFVAINIPAYYFFYYPPNNQIEHAQKVAESFKPYIKKQPIQMVPIPTTETDGHYRYFLETEGYELMPQDSPEQAQELYVVCFEECKPLDDPQWQIAAFYNKSLAGSWKAERATIYKIIHKQ
ncbi:glycosyltransferase family 39 protein [Candidatus Woesebacteria bacterium]|nr:glycosyltransferase family 39 protein [Candidatus Woesebacteria bacterium]